MARTYSTMIDLGARAPEFSLPIVNPSVDDLPGPKRALADFSDAEILVVVFTCNHCPFAVHVEDAILNVAREYRKRGVQFIAICSNDASTHPEDRPEALALRAAEKDFPFPYLHDETQDVARAFGAVCTPDFFVYDQQRELVYRGRFDESRPGHGTATGSDLRNALDALRSTGIISSAQYPSVGCNIKWKAESAAPR